jgi:hypothetical protein
MKETQNTIIYARFIAIYCQKCAFVMVLQRFFLISSTLSKMLFPEGADSPSFILVSLSAPIPQWFKKLFNLSLIIAVLAISAQGQSLVLPYIKIIIIV